MIKCKQSGRLILLLQSAQHLPGYRCSLGGIGSYLLLINLLLTMIALTLLLLHARFKTATSDRLPIGESQT